MSSTLSEKQIHDFKKQLKIQYRTLREEIRQELLASDNEHYNRLAGQVHDTGDESVADLLVDVNLAIIDQHVNEIRDIDVALLAISTGDYGTCSDCGGEINYKRLQANSSAIRCHNCQLRHEKTYAQKGHPTL